MKKLFSVALLILMVVFFSVPGISMAGDDLPQTDLCLNLSGIQTEVPGGYHASGDDCIVFNENGMPTQRIIEEDLKIDVCLNIPEIQETIPAGYAKVPNGDCKEDLCKNISGNQFDIPTGHVRIDNTDCLPDICPNLVGAQAKMPNNYYEGDGGECFLNLDIRFNTLDGVKLTTPRDSGKYVYDACPNMFGIQGGVPAGYTKNNLTNRCTKIPVIDLCNNIEGVQKTLPKNNLRREDGSCYNKLTAPKIEAPKITEETKR